MRTVSAACAAILLIAAAPAAQYRPDFSGRWRLVEPGASDFADDMLVVGAPDELLITDTPRTITIDHPSKRGTHPEPGAFEYGVGGTVSGPANGRATIAERWEISHIGTQLIITRSTTGPPDDRGLRITIARGSMWRLEGPTRLVIEFSEERSGERPKIATRVYEKVAVQGRATTSAHPIAQT